MKTIAVQCEKGGIGKTMTATAIAYILGVEMDKKVLVIDADQQGDTSKTLDEFSPEGIGLSQLLEEQKHNGGTYGIKEVIKPTKYKNIDIITSNGYLMRTNILIAKSEEEQIHRLKNALEHIEGFYDYCICDCGLMVDATVLNVLVAADVVVVPVPIGGREIAAIEKFKNNANEIKNINKKLTVKCLVTMARKNKLTEEIKEWLQSEHDCYKAFIRYSIAANKSTFVPEPLPVFSKRCAAAMDYRELTQEILKELEV